MTTLWEEAAEEAERPNFESCYHPIWIYLRTFVGSFDEAMMNDELTKQD